MQTLLLSLSLKFWVPDVKNFWIKRGFSEKKNRTETLSRKINNQDRVKLIHEKKLSITLVTTENTMNLFTFSYTFFFNFRRYIGNAYNYQVHCFEKVQDEINGPVWLLINYYKYMARISESDAVVSYISVAWSPKVRPFNLKGAD